MASPVSAKLPQLLSLLPQTGLHTIVRPLTPSPKHKNSIFLITRTHLKYKLLPPKPDPSTSTPTTPAKPISRGNNTASTAKAEPIAPRRAKQLKPRRDNIGAGLGVEGLMKGEGEMLVYGKAWGMHFKNGKFTPPAIASKIPDPLVEPHKIQWVTVPRSSLSAEETLAIDNWRTTYEEALAKRALLLESRKARAMIRKEEYEERVRVEEEAKAVKKREGHIVKIIY